MGKIYCFVSFRVKDCVLDQLIKVVSCLQEDCHNQDIDRHKQKSHLIKIYLPQSEVTFNKESITIFTKWSQMYIIFLVLIHNKAIILIKSDFESVISFRHIIIHKVQKQL